METNMWRITEKQYTSEDGESYTGYGVTSGECTVNDVTLSLEEITRFVAELNKHQASQAHIYELIDNFLAEI